MKSKAGFGLIEIVASMVIFALMFSAVMEMQYVNRAAALRMQTRNEANQIAQNVADSLQTLGIASVRSGTFTRSGPSRNLAQGGAVSTQFTVAVVATTVLAKEISTGSGSSAINFQHEQSKKLDIRVSWTTSGHTFSITHEAVVE
jgi:prepilin-type N-terminal cleavage/methylation domain-containing protein